MVPAQCPTCGRVSEDWSQRAPGAKARQRKDRENRLTEYTDWRRKLGDDFYCTDVDQLEWREIDGVLTPVAVLELTMVEGNAHVPQKYLNNILDRFLIRDGQGEMAQRLAAKLGVKAWIVLFRWDLTEFWVYDLCGTRRWYHTSPAKYKAWLEGLPDGKQALTQPER